MFSLRKRIAAPEKRYLLQDGRTVGLFRKNETSKQKETTFLSLKNEKGKPICQLGFEIIGNKGLFDYTIKTRGKPLSPFSKERSYRHMKCAETLLRLSLQEMKEKGVEVVEAPFLPGIGKERLVETFLKKHGFKEPDKVHLPSLSTLDIPAAKLKNFYTGLPTFVIKDLKKLNIPKVPLEEVSE